MRPSVDITRPFKMYLKTLILDPEEYETPKQMLTEIQKYINRKVQAVYDVSGMTKKDILELHADIDDPAYHDHSMIIVRIK